MRLILYCALSIFGALPALLPVPQTITVWVRYTGLSRPQAMSKTIISSSNGYVVDTRYGDPAVPAVLRATPAAGPAYHIIQFPGANPAGAGLSSWTGWE